MPTERFIIEVREDGTRRVIRRLNDVGGAARGAESAVAFLKRGLGLLGGALAIGGITRTLANFSQEISTVRAITGATEDQFRALSERAQELGSTTRFSASEAAQGLQFLARAGFDVTESLETVDDTLLLAQAGGLALGSAADIASNVLAGFRLETDQATRVVDVLARAANSANTDVLQLGDALKFVAPVASGLGVSVEETTAAIGKLSDAGLQASLAGTGLRRVLSELESPANKSREILAAYGITADEVKISQVGLTAAVQRLAEAGLDTAAALEIFGDRGGPAFAVLSESIGDVEELTAVLEGAEGTAQSIAEVMDDNLNGALLSVRSAFEGLILAIGDAGFTDVLRSGAEATAAALRFLTENIEDVKLVLLALSPVFVAVFGPPLIALLSAATGAFVAFGAALLANPIGLIAAAVAGLVIAFVALKDVTIDVAGETVRIGDIVRVVGERLVSFGRTVIDAASAFFDALIPAAEATGGAFTRAFDNIVQVFQVWLRAQIQVIDAAGQFGAFLANVAESIFNNFETFVLAIPDLFIEIFNFILRRATNFVNNIADILSTVTEFAGLGSIGNVGTFQLGSFGALRNAADLVREDVEQAANFQISEIIGGAFSKIIDEAAALSAQRTQATLEDDNATRQLTSSVEQNTEALSQNNEVSAGSAEAARDRAAALAEIVLGLEQEAFLLSLGSEERRVQERLLQIVNQLRQDNIELTQQETAALEEQIRANIELSDSVKEQERILQRINGAQEKYNESVEALGALLADGSITLAQYNEELRNVEIALLETQTTASAGFERAILKLQRDFDDLASGVEGAVTNAFNNAGDAIKEFVTEGRLNFSALKDGVISDITEIAVQQAVLKPLSGLFGGGAGGGGLFGSVGSFLQGGGLFGGLLGFAEGGSFAVGGVGGIDSQVVAFRASPGERVSIDKPGEMRGMGNANVTINVTTPDANSFRKSQAQIMAEAQATLSRQGRRNN